MVWVGCLVGVFYWFFKVVYKMGVKLLVVIVVMSKILCGEICYVDIVNIVIKKLSSSFLLGRG